MYDKKKIFVLLISLVLFFACSAQKVMVKDPPAFDFCGSDVMMVKDVKDTPLNQTTDFSTEDKQVAALVKCRNVSNKQDLRWEWYSPKNELYLRSENVSLNAAKDKYRPTASAWHSLPVSAAKEKKLYGNWQVKVYLNEKILTVKNFKISPSDIIPPEIIITSENLTRDLKINKIEKSAMIAGKVIDQSGIAYVKINNRDAILNVRGEFSLLIDLQPGENNITVSAMDTHDNRAEKKIVMFRHEERPSPLVQWMGNIMP